MDNTDPPSPTPDKSAPPMRSAPTIRDVARMAGVSIGTVSKALNAGGRLRQETRDNVIKVAREIGYRPNDLAQSLHRAKSRTIGIISNDSFGRFTFPIVEALEERLADEGIAVFMCNATDDPARERQHLDQLLGKRVDGLVVTARRADKRVPIGPHAHGLPVIYVFSQADDPQSLSLLPDDEGGAVLAVEHLATIGRHRIAHLTGPEHFEAVRLRKAGYLAGLKAAGLSATDGFYLPGVWSEAWGREAISRLFDGRKRTPDALFCGNDQIATGAAQVLQQMGRIVPDDVAIVGYDNWEVLAADSQPPLTTVDLNLESLGATAVMHLFEALEGKPNSGVIRQPCRLVVRESTAPRG
jgi:LacI family transcriptional regulator